MVVVLLVLALVGYKMLTPKHSDTNNSPDTVSNTITSEQIPANFDDFDDILPSYVDDNPNSVSNIAINAPITAPATVITEAPIFRVMAESNALR